MRIRVGINGMGRIGRDVLRSVIDRDEPAFEIVAVNDLAPVETVAHLLHHDSTYGPWHRRVGVAGDFLAVDDHPVRALEQPDPALLAWGALGVDVVVDATGKFRTRERAAAHRGSPQGGAHRTRHRRRRNDRAGRQPGRLRRHDARHHLQRLEHHELRGTDGAGAAPRLRDRGRPAHWTGSRCGSRSWTPRWST
jgi:hypothetical protein